MKKLSITLTALVLSMPSIGWCIMLVRYSILGTMPAWLACAGIILFALIGGITWQMAHRPSIVEEVARMPLYDLLCLLNERSDIHKVIINELEGTDYHEEPEDNA